MKNTNNATVILLTRFSVRSEKFMRAAHIESESDRDHWFNIRSAIFKSATYPSIKAQKLIPKRWYLLLAAGDEELYKKYIDLKDDLIYPIYIEPGDSLSGKIGEHIQRDFKDKKDMFISRIDNDDALDENFFSTIVHSAYREKANEDTYFLYRTGIRWDGSAGQILDYPNNPFITVYSPNWHNTKPNPLGLNHTTVLEHKHAFVNSHNNPMWLQTLHGTNASNDFLPKRGGIVKTDPVEICRQFHMDLTTLDALEMAKSTSLKPAATAGPSIIKSNINTNKETPMTTVDRLDPKTARPRRLNAIAKLISARSYLEIGVCTGDTFFAVDVDRKVAVDPRFRFDPAEVEDHRSSFFQITSNEYFIRPDAQDQFDLVFLDGFHSFEQIMIDFQSALTLTDSKSVIVIDDTVPNDIYSAIPNQRIAFKYRKQAGNKSLSWHGDVFKIVLFIHDFCPTLSFATFNSGGNQQTVVWREPRVNYKPILGNLEKISRLDFVWLMENFSVLNPLPEPEVFNVMTKWANEIADGEKI